MRGAVRESVRDICYGSAVIDLVRGTNAHVLGRYFNIAHCIVSLYKSVSNREKIPSGRSLRVAMIGKICLCDRERI